MDRPTSWPVPIGGPDYRKIVVALQRRDIRWSDRCAAWLERHFGTEWSKRAVEDAMLAFVKAEGVVRGQKNVPGWDHAVWFSVEIERDGVLRFIKFVIEPDEDENPGILIVSTHPPH